VAYKARRCWQINAYYPLVLLIFCEKGSYCMKTAQAMNPEMLLFCHLPAPPEESAGRCRQRPCWPLPVPERSGCCSDGGVFGRIGIVTHSMYLLKICFCFSGRKMLVLKWTDFSLLPKSVTSPNKQYYGQFFMYSF